MTGGIMPKLFAVRWPLGISVVVLLAAGTIGFATSLSSRPTIDAAVADDYAGERQQLSFFKAAIGRIDDELRHRGAAATPSLRIEREAVLRRMREVAGRVPAERLPAEIATLLQSAPAAAPNNVTARPTERAAPKIEVRKLQTGLGTKQAEIDFTGLALELPEPLPVFVERPPRRAEHARDGEPAAEKPAKHRPAKAKERPAAEKPSKEEPAADRAAGERPPADRAVAARPPVTVERTAVVDQPEPRQPAR
jgi:hypothetical protein